MTAPITHSATAYRKPTGWLRWFASCTCGWGSEAKSREDAYRFALVHELERGPDGGQ